ncbi:MAG: PEP-CTERM sorting domain-containing protein [Sedimentisphaerales bacterium]|nr:PEP-CTERM sorting domain-containing protein [Sedimentisphaerales bacterium]
MRKMKFVFVLAVLATCALAQAAYKTPAVENFSFENPADGKHNAWDLEANAKPAPGNMSSVSDVPGWFSDWTALDSGVEGPDAWPGTTDGHWAGFMMNGPDPSTWQILGYKVQAGDQFALAVDSRDNWSAITPAQLQMSLFYVAIGGARTVLATQIVPLTTTWTTFKLDLPDASLGLGRLLGIELLNVSDAGTSTGNSWIGIDNVRFVPEPATLVLLGLGGLLLRRKR